MITPPLGWQGPQKFFPQKRGNLLARSDFQAALKKRAAPASSPWFPPAQRTGSCSEPVSYTHLDVYKRQSHGRTENPGNFLFPQQFRRLFRLFPACLVKFQVRHAANLIFSIPRRFSMTGDIEFHCTAFFLFPMINKHSPTAVSSAF